MCLVSVAGLVGGPVRNPGGAVVGRVADVIIRWDAVVYTPLRGLVVRAGRRRAFVPVEEVVELSRRGVQLSSARLDVTDFETPGRGGGVAPWVGAG